MNSEKPAETIQTLLEAEEQAKKAIESARQERDVRLKQAASEAEAEIIDYRAQKDAEYKAQKQKYAGTSEEVSLKIALESKQNIKKTINEAESNKLAVVNMLVRYVKNVAI